MRSFDLQSRVARRLFGLFFLAALVPVAVSGLITYTQIKHQLIDLSQRRLREESKAIGMNLVGRLNVRAVELQRLAARPDLLDQIDWPADRDFVRIERVKKAAIELSRKQQRHLVKGGVVLLTDDAPAYSILVALPDSPQLLRATLNMRTLWQDDNVSHPYCILGVSGKIHFCSAELSGFASGFSPAQFSHSGVLTWEGRDESYLAGYWQALLQGGFANDGLIVVSFHLQQDALEALHDFQHIYPAFLALTLAAAALLALVQIRRQLRPLHNLAEGARRLAQGSFDVTVAVDNRDEFGDLAHVFNQMSQSLKQKFHLLKVLGELDQAILTASEIEYVIQTILEYAPLAMDCDWISVLQTQAQSAPETGLLTYRVIGKPTAFTRLEVQLDATSLSLIDTDQHWIDLSQSDHAVSFLEPPGDMDSSSVWLFPAASNQRSSMFLIMGFRESVEETDEILTAGRNIADRLTVAGSNLAWEEKLYHNAHYDALTDLPNRVLLRDRIEQAINRAKRDDKAFAILLIDLDRFKEVNDSMGHSTGDELLVRVSRILSSSIRKYDTLSRLGGDEFIIVLTDLDKTNLISIVGSIAEMLLKQLKDPIQLDSQIVTISGSIGIALYPDSAESIEELLKSADAAMYASKREQLGGYRFYSQGINELALERFQMIQDLRRAIVNQEFTLYYQPKVDTLSGKIVGAEALIRWQSPSRGMLPPGMFIKLIEEIGLSNPLGEWVLSNACSQLAQWDRKGLPPITLSVNVSPTHLLEADFVDKVLDTISSQGLAQHRIELEILEESAVDASEQTRDKLSQLQDQGVHIALDDFGTGYSSLIYLTQIPATVLKLDRAFIRPLTYADKQARIVWGIITLAKTLDMKVVAEGVEEYQQLALLKEMGCDLIQGYLFSPPVSAVEFEQLLASQPYYANRKSITSLPIGE